MNDLLDYVVVTVMVGLVVGFAVVAVLEWRDGRRQR
jgi:hypothetical protein